VRQGARREKQEKERKSNKKGREENNELCRNREKRICTKNLPKFLFQRVNGCILTVKQTLKYKFLKILKKTQPIRKDKVNVKRPCLFLEINKRSKGQKVCCKVQILCHPQPWIEQQQ